MRAAVVVFPGSNCDRDMVEALRQSGADVAKVWHKDADLPQGLDLVAIPGGFSLAITCGAVRLRRNLPFAGRWSIMPIVAAMSWGSAMAFKS